MPDYARFAIYPRNAWGTNQNHLYVYQGTDASSFETTPVADFDNTFVTNGDSYNNTPEIPLKETTRAIKIEYQKVSQNAGITNLFVTSKVSSAISEQNQTPISVSTSKGYFRVNGLSQTRKVVIYDILGKEVYQRIVDNGTDNSFSFKGLFIIKIDDYVQK